MLEDARKRLLRLLKIEEEDTYTDIGLQKGFKILVEFLTRLLYITEKCLFYQQNQTGERYKYFKANIGPFCRPMSVYVSFSPMFKSLGRL